MIDAVLVGLPISALHGRDLLAPDNLAGFCLAETA